MSSPFTEQQIRAFARDELRKILDSGLFYTAGCSEGKQPAPSVSPTPLKPSATPPTLQMPEAIAHLTETIYENGYHIISPKHFLPPADFTIVNDWVKQQHGEYVKATNNTPGHWRIKQ